MFCFCFFCAFASIFHLKLCSFVGGGSKYFLPPGAGTLATPLIMININSNFLNRSISDLFESILL